MDMTVAGCLRKASGVPACFLSCPSIWSSHCQLWTVWTLDTPLLPVLWWEKSCQPFVWYFYIQLNTLLLLKKENMDAPWCAVGGRRQSIAGERELGMLLRTKVASSPSSIFSDIFFIFVIWIIISTDKSLIRDTISSISRDIIQQNSAKKPRLANHRRLSLVLVIP